jgi:hypothetical protein
MEHLPKIMHKKWNMSSAVEHQDQQVQWRRDKVQELCSKGYSQRDISQIIQDGLATVNIDISYLRDQVKSNIKKYIDDRLQEEYEKCLVGLSAMEYSQTTEHKREKIQTLSLAKECYSMNLDLLTNTIVVDDAIRFVSNRSDEKLKLSTSNEEESNEPDYDEYEDRLDEEQEEQTGEITVNHVF